MPKINDSQLADRLDFAVAIAREAGELTLKYFRSGELRIEQKADHTPVTVADRAAERLLRESIAGRFPTDSIIGEEFNASQGTSEYEWVLDPIDGTKSFIHGVPLYTTLVAVRCGNTPCVGVIHAPALEEMVYAAAGGGCWHVAKPGEPVRAARVSRVSSLADALFLTTDIESFTNERDRDAIEVFQRLQANAKLTRLWGDGFGYLMVATGRAEVMVDPAVSLWDRAALQPVIEEAGGSFTDWQGSTKPDAADAIATNGLVKDEVLAITSEF